MYIERYDDSKQIAGEKKKSEEESKKKSRERSTYSRQKNDQRPKRQDKATAWVPLTGDILHILY